MTRRKMLGRSRSRSSRPIHKQSVELLGQSTGPSDDNGHNKKQRDAYRSVHGRGCGAAGAAVTITRNMPSTHPIQKRRAELLGHNKATVPIPNGGLSALWGSKKTRGRCIRRCPFVVRGRRRSPVAPSSHSSGVLQVRHGMGKLHAVQSHRSDPGSFRTSERRPLGLACSFATHS